MTPPIRHDLDAMLAHAGWIRALARSLAVDPHVADDLVQQTWVAALEHPPESGRPVRRWFAAVMRNFVRQDRRAGARRLAREAAVARPEALDPSHASAESIAQQRALLEAVLELDEPYRTVIIQRYYEGLPPRKIAERHDVPVKTVKTRLNRGLEKLRARLDAESRGDRSAWLAAFAPLLGRSPLAPATLGALIMDAKLKAVIGVVVLAGAVATYAHYTAAPDLASASLVAKERTPAELQGDVPKDAPLVAVSEEPRSQRSNAVRPAPTADPAPVVAAAPDRLRGRVVDVDHHPVANVDVGAVVLWREKKSDQAQLAPLARTGADGSFEMEPPDGTVRLEVQSREWITVLQAYLWGNKKDIKPVIVVARRQLLGGIVLGKERKPIENAEVSLDLGPELRRDVGEILDTAMEKNWSVRTDAEGRFELSDAPSARGKIVVRSPLYADHAEPIPEHPAPDLVIVLELLEMPHVVVRGIVLDAKSAPVEDAYVVLGNRTVQSAKDGRFEIDVRESVSKTFTHQDEYDSWVREDDTSRIVALKYGHLPAQLDLPSFEVLRQRAEPELFRLHLGEAPPSIRGIVQDDEGRPIEDVVIEPLGESRFGRIAQHSGTATASYLVTLEKMLRGGVGASDVVSDAQGHFELIGLLDKDYRLFALHRKTLRFTETGPIAAGTTGVVITITSEEKCRRVAGRVMSKAGTPVEGAIVVPIRKRDPKSLPTHGEQTATDAQGHFEFPHLAAGGADFGLQVTSETMFLVFWREIGPDEKLDDLVITVSRRCHVQIDLSDRPSLADHFAAFDAKGARVKIMAFMGVAIFFPDEVGISDGRSDPVAVEEDTRTLVFYKDKAEVLRLPVDLKPGELKIVRP